MAAMGRTCIVTGASAGIGREIALALARSGAKVWAVARRSDELRARVALSRGPGCIEPYPADLADDAQIQSLARDLCRGTGALTCLYTVPGNIGASV